MLISKFKLPKTRGEARFSDPSQSELASDQSLPNTVEASPPLPQILAAIATRRSRSAACQHAEYFDGWTLFIDSDGNGTLNDDEPRTSSDENGQFIFDNLGPDTYHISGLMQPGWSRTNVDIIVEMTNPAGTDSGTDRATHAENLPCRRAFDPQRLQIHPLFRCWPTPAASSG